MGTNSTFASGELPIKAVFSFLQRKHKDAILDAATLQTMIDHLLVCSHVCLVGGRHLHPFTCILLPSLLGLIVLETHSNLHCRVLVDVSREYPVILWSCDNTIWSFDIICCIKYCPAALTAWQCRIYSERHHAFYLHDLCLFYEEFVTKPRMGCMACLTRVSPASSN